MKTPADKTIAFLFVSHPTKDLALRWQARLTFPPSSTDESMLEVVVVDGLGAPVQEGVLELAGNRIEIGGGRGAVRYRDFALGRHSVPLWLYRPGVVPIPGGLTFG